MQSLLRRWIVEELELRSFLLGAVVVLLLLSARHVASRLRRRIGRWTSGTTTTGVAAKRCDGGGGKDDDDDDAFFSDSIDDCKLVLCVRQDLGMQKGKIAAQCSHATLGAYRRAAQTGSPFLERWEDDGQAKVALKVESLDALMNLKSQAATLKLNHFVVRDAGRTQIPSGSVTVLAIGPGPASRINEVTGHLKLL